jgi:hypothetical protein
VVIWRQHPPRLAHTAIAPACFARAAWKPLRTDPGRHCGQVALEPEVGADKIDVPDGGLVVSQASHEAGKMPDRRFVSARGAPSGGAVLPSRKPACNTAGRRRTELEGGRRWRQRPACRWSAILQTPGEDDGVQDPRVNARVGDNGTGRWTSLPFDLALVVCRFPQEAFKRSAAFLSPAPRRLVPRRMEATIPPGTMASLTAYWFPFN